MFYSEIYIFLGRIFTTWSETFPVFEKKNIYFFGNLHLFLQIFFTTCSENFPIYERNFHLFLRIFVFISTENFLQLGQKPFLLLSEIFIYFFGNLNLFLQIFLHFDLKPLTNSNSVEKHYFVYKNCD